MQFIKSSLLVTALMVVTASCSFAELKVVATISDLACIAEAVGGNDIEVSLLCPGHRDPHFLPAKPSLAHKMSKADLLCYNGLELEIGWLPLLLNKARNPRIKPGSKGDMDCSTALKHVLDVPGGNIDRAMGDIHALGNPHYTLNPENAVLIAQEMAFRMGQLDSANKDAYQARADAFADEVATRLPGWIKLMENARTKSILIYHSHWNYFTEWQSLNVVGEIENRPGITPSPRHIHDIIEKGRHLENCVIMAAEWDHHEIANKVADRIDAPLAILPGYSGAQEGTDNYFDFIDRLCSSVAQAAAQE
ncbi:MAG: zinc ABC transporter solute-binding protein [bacterium]|nr:zinc ABC transporter solute-binding protein [bacterium]MCP4798402.1 zinc ABC transporter solute-binding protein [bacterium]